MARSILSVPSRGKNQIFRLYVCVSICKVNRRRLAAENPILINDKMYATLSKRASFVLFVCPSPTRVASLLSSPSNFPPRLWLSLINPCLICYLFSLITVVTLSRRSAAWLSHLRANSLFMFFHHGTIFLWQTSEQQLQGGLMGQSSVGMQERRQVSSLLLPFLSS